MGYLSSRILLRTDFFSEKSLFAKRKYFSSRGFPKLNKVGNVTNKDIHGGKQNNSANKECLEGIRFGSFLKSTEDDFTKLSKIQTDSEMST